MLLITFVWSRPNLDKELGMCTHTLHIERTLLVRRKERKNK